MQPPTSAPTGNVHGAAQAVAAAPRLEDLTKRELLARLVILQNRTTAESAAGGYQPVPGQTSRKAHLRRREQAITRELRQRREKQ